MADLSERQGAVIIGFIWAFTIIAAVTAGLRLYVRKEIAEHELDLA